MLLKRQEKNGLIRGLYESSNILASTYNESTNDLEIIFKSGTKYKYSNVSKSDYMRFEIAESQGVVFNSHIKKYAFEKLENVDVNEIISEANSLAEVEIESRKKEIIETIGGFNPSINDSNESFINSLNKLQTKITEFLEFMKKN